MYQTSIIKVYVRDFEVAQLVSNLISHPLAQCLILKVRCHLSELFSHVWMFFPHGLFFHMCELSFHMRRLSSNVCAVRTLSSVPAKGVRVKKKVVPMKC